MGEKLVASIKKKQKLGQRGLTKQLETLTNKKANIEYSSGNSDYSSRLFEIAYRKLNKKQKKMRMQFLWKKAIAKAKGASVVVNMHIR